MEHHKFHRPFWIETVWKISISIGLDVAKPRHIHCIGHIQMFILDLFRAKEIATTTKKLEQLPDWIVLCSVLHKTKMIAAAAAACIEITIVVKSLFVMQTNIKKLKCQISAWFGMKSLFKSYYLVFVVCIYENRPKVSTIT